MFCPKCGTQCADTERFCPSCGEALGEQTAPETTGATGSANTSTSTAGSAGTAPSAKKSSPSIPVKPIIIGVVALIAVVLIFKVVGGLFSGGGSSTYASYSKDALFTLYNTDDQEYVVYAGSKEVGSVDSYGLSYSRDGSVAFCRDSEGTMYAISSKGVNKAGSDVSSALYSADGSVLVYVDEDYQVHWYDVAKDKDEKLGSGDEGAAVFAVAPDGSAAAYILYDGDDVEAFTVQAGKKPVSLGKNIFPFAISNKNTYVYYLKVKNLPSVSSFESLLSSSITGTMYVKKGNNEVKLASDFGMSGNYLFNSDCSQMIYNEDGKAYITVKGGEKQRILSSSASYMLTPPRTAAAFSTGGSVYIYSVSDLRGQCYRTSGGIYYVDSKGESNKLVSDYNSVYLSADGKSLIYLKNGDLKKIDDVSKGSEKEITDDADIRSFVATPDLSAVYYLNDDDTLYYQKGTGKAVEVGDDPDAFFMSADGSTCFIIADEAVCTSKGKAWSKIKDLSDDVDDYGFARGTCYFVQDDGDEVNVYTTNGSSPKSLVSGFEGYVS